MNITIIYTDCIAPIAELLPCEFVFMVIMSEFYPITSSIFKNHHIFHNFTLDF